MKTLAALMLAALVLAGCGASLEKQIVGNWKVDTAKTTMTGEAAKDPESKKMMMAMMETITLNIKDDKSFEMQVFMPIKGTWVLTGNKLVMTPAKDKNANFKFGGKDTMDFVVNADGKSMTSTINDPQQGGTLVMVKSEAAK
jgi:uncharacterized lipoprotein NlpE involved in copper resistance